MEREKQACACSVDDVVVVVGWRDDLTTTRRRRSLGSALNFLVALDGLLV